MRHVVEAMGLDWASQFKKLSSSEVFTCMDIHTRDTLGRQQCMLSMRVEDFPLWLASINPAKVKDEAKRAKIILEIKPTVVMNTMVGVDSKARDSGGENG